MDENRLIKSCLAGQKRSLEKLIRITQSRVFNLTLRFLGNREDAEDASQEILIKIITNLNRFKGYSKFSTWSYRIAINYLLNLKRTKLEQKFFSFDAFEKDLSIIQDPSDYDMPDKTLMLKELKTGCTLAMLLCLDRDLRVAFILGSTLKINSKIAAEITETTPDNFRKRLEFARKRMRAFLNNNCGVYNPNNNCRCSKRINDAINYKRIKREKLNFVGTLNVEEYNKEMEELNSLSGIYQNQGRFKSNNDLITRINQMLSTKRIMSYHRSENI